MSELSYSVAAIPDGISWCRLCLNFCGDYKILYDRNGVCNTVCYEIAYKYFHPAFLTIARGTSLTVLCLSCWRLISEFNVFQMSILAAQNSLLSREDMHVEKFPTTPESMETNTFETTTTEPTHETELPEVRDDTNNMAWIDIEDVLENLEEPKPMPMPDVVEMKQEDSIKQEPKDPSEGQEESFEEYEDPVGVFVGGEFGNAEQTNELSQTGVSNMDVSSMADNSVPETGIDNEALANIPSPALDTNILQQSNDQLRVADTTTPASPKVDSKILQQREEQKELNEIISHWRPMLQCLVCNTFVASYTQLRQHFKKSHPQKKCYIECCESRFYKPQEIKEHVLQHICLPKVHKCEICKNTFKTLRQLKTHVLQKHSIATDAKKDAASQEETPDIHHKNNKHETARKRFAEKASRLKEERTKFDEFIAKWQPNLQCLVCNVSLPAWSLMREHYGQHHPNRKFFIKCCGLKLHHRFQLKNHGELHVFPHGFNCESCNVNFKTQSDLKKHNPCSQLKTNKREKEATTRERHSANQFDPILEQWQTPLECIVCKVTYPNYLQLRCHFWQLHPGVRWQITCCQRKYSTMRHIGEHALFHVDPNAFKCQLCGMCLSSSFHLYSHMYYAHNVAKGGKEVERSHTCSFCEKAFRCMADLQEHVATHTGSDLYKCLHCPQTFKIRNLAYRHFKSCHPKEWAEKKKVRNFFKLLEINNSGE